MPNDITIRVTFYSADTGQVFATSEIPASSLPESFLVATTLHLGDEDWEVVSADPPTAEEFRKTGALSLRLRRVARMDPNEILYSLPTLSDAIPETDPGSRASGRRVLRLHEDDWRQIELISA